jgi:ribosomal-protein-serine acetyltransferase
MLTLPIEANLELWLLEPRHAPELYALAVANRAHIRAWMDWLDDGYSVETARAQIVAALHRLADTGAPEYGVRFENALVGMVRINRIDPTNRSGTIGYWLAADRTGRGIAGKAVAALVEHAFESLGLHRLEIHCNARNLASRRVAERLGFVQEGVLCRAEARGEGDVTVFDDTVIYGLLESEWRKR